MMLDRCPKYAPNTGIRTVPPEKTLERVIPLLQKAGMEPMEDITGLDNIGIPVYSVYRKTTAKGTFGNYNGKGPTPEQAGASAAMEALERYCAEQRDTDEVVYGTYRQACEIGPAVNPADLILPLPVLNYIEDAEIAWVRAYDLFAGEKTWVPACEVFYPYYPDGDVQLYKFHTNGIAAGNTMEEAILHGLLELIERDAWSLAEDVNVAKADIVIDDDESVPAELLRRFREKGVEIHLKDLTSDIGIPTIGAAADDTATKDPEMLTIGVGTHLNPEIAAVRAITEVAQSRTTHKHGIKTNARLQKIAQDMGYDRIKEINRLWYRDCIKKTNLKDFEDLSTPYVLDDIEVVLGRLADTGFEKVLAADLTRPEIGVPVVRMIVPGLEVSTMDADREGARIKGMWPPRR